MKAPKNSKPGDPSRSAFFKKGKDQAFFGKSKTIQRKAETNLSGNYTGNYVFNPGFDGLDRNFFNKVKRAVADGSLSDADITALRKDAIDRNGTVEHAELLLMAAMRNPTNVTAMKSHTSGTLVISGGVAANSRIKALAAERCAAAGIELRVPRPRLCTDNGAMIAALGAHLVAAGIRPSALDLPTDPGLPVDTVYV